MENEQYFYISRQVKQLPQKQQLAKIKLLPHVVPGVGALEQGVAYVVGKIKNKEDAYMIYKVRMEGQAEPEIEQHVLITNSKPVYVLDAERTLVRRGMLLGIKGQASLELGFKAKFVVPMENPEEFLVGGNRSLRDFKIVTIRGLTLEARPAKFPFVDIPELRGALMVHHIDRIENQVIMSIYNSKSETYQINNYTYVKAQDQFIKSDTYRLKPGKIVNLIKVTHLAENKSYVKVIICYDCSKLVEIIFNNKVLEGQERPSYVGHHNKIKHTFNFGQIDALVKMQDTKDIVVSDLVSSPDHQSRFLTIFKESKYSRKSFSEKERTFDGKYSENLLLLEDHPEVQNMLILPHFSDAIVFLNLSEAHLQLFNLERLSLEDTMQHFLDKNRISVALQIQEKYNLSSSLLFEFQLRKSKYADIVGLKEYLQMFEEDRDDGFIKVTNIILNEEVNGTEAMELLLRSNQQYLVDKINGDEDESEQDKALLRQILCYQQRLMLAKKLDSMYHINITWPQWADDGSHVQKIVLMKDYVQLCNQIFYEFQIEDQLELSGGQFETIFDEILQTLMMLTYHEFALNYQRILEILPLEKLSSQAICEVLPSAKQQNQSQFWINISNIIQGVQGEESVIEDKEVQEQFWAQVIEELQELDLPEKALEVARTAIEQKGLSTLAIGKLAVQSIQRQMELETYNDITVPQLGLKLVRFGASSVQDDVPMIAENIHNYLSKAKFVFHRNSELYIEYLSQLKYYVSYILDPSMRQELLSLMVSEQAQRELQFTIRDSELVQIILELIYCPSFRPYAPGSSLFTELPEVKYMGFNSETVKYLSKHILPFLQESIDEYLETTVNQKAFIENNLLNHVKIGMLPVFQQIYFAHLQQKSKVVDGHGLEFQLNTGQLRFTDLLRIQNDDLSNSQEGFAMELVKDIIEAQIKQSSGKRETLKKHLTSTTTTLFSLFQTQGGQVKGSSDRKWVNLHIQICEVLDLLKYDSQPIQELFLRRMLEIGNFEALGEIMGDPASQIESQIINKCVLDHIRKQFDEIVFERMVNQEDNETDQLHKSQQTTQYMTFYQQSISFLRLLLSNSQNSDFTKQCQSEIDLLETTKELLVHDLLIWFIPLVQIREAFAEQAIFQRILQVHGVQEIFPVVAAGQRKADVAHRVEMLAKSFMVGEEKVVQMVCQLVLHMQRVKMIGTQSVEMVFVKDVVQMYLVKEEYNLTALKGGPYAEINELILEMVKGDSGQEHKECIDYLLGYGNLFKSSNFDDLCQLYYEANLEMSKPSDSKFLQLSQSLHLRQKYKSLTLLQVAFQGSLDSLAQQFKEANIDLDFSQVEYMIQLLSLSTDLDEESILQLRHMHERLQRQTGEGSGIEFILDDGKQIENLDQPREEIPTEQRSDLQQMWNLKSSDDQEMRAHDRQQVHAFLEENYAEASPSAIVQAISQQGEISQDVLTFSIDYLVNQRRDKEKVDLDSIENLSFSLHHILSQLQEASPYHFFIYVLSFFGQLVKLEVPAHQVNTKTPLQSFTYDVLVHVIPFNLMLLSLELQDLIDDANFHSLSDCFEDIDEILAQQEPQNAPIPLFHLLLLVYHLKATYQKLRYQNEPNIDIDEIITNSEEPAKIKALMDKLKVQINKVVYKESK